MKTVKVRIAVAVDHTGGWMAAGWSPAVSELLHYDQCAMASAADGVTDGEARYWVEAELAIPESVVIQGMMSNA